MRQKKESSQTKYGFIQDHAVQRVLAKCKLAADKQTLTLNSLPNGPNHTPLTMNSLLGFVDIQQWFMELCEQQNIRQKF